VAVHCLQSPRRSSLTMTSLKAYLAEKYMSGPKAEAILSKVGPQKKKKRKATTTASASASGARIVDEDGGWVEQPQEEAEDLEDVVIEKDRGFKKRKVDQKAMEASGGWAVVQESIEQEEEREHEDEKPVVVETFVGGLLAAKDLKMVLDRKPEKRQKGRSEGVSDEDIARMQETVYRDASGRRIDTKAERAEAARLKREREEQEAKKMEWGKGLVQKDEEEKRKREIEKQKATAFARRADDKELNEDLMAKELWNDPAAAFLTVSKL
jgi:pre-mRNA-splicing factor CWC26